jgi:hypothetical protein
MLLDSSVFVPPRGARLRRIQMIDEEHGELPLSLRLEFAARNEFEARAEEVVRGLGDVYLADRAG